MTRIANKIKEVKDPDKRKEILLEDLKKFTEKLDKTPGSKPFQLPLDPRLQARGLLVQKCKYMDSKKVQPISAYLSLSLHTLTPPSVAFVAGLGK